MLIALAVPNFGKVLNLIGGSLITLCTFILPPVMYMRLVNDKSNKTWPERCVCAFDCVCVCLCVCLSLQPLSLLTRTIPMWEKVFLVEVIIVGIVGGVLSTITGVYDVIQASFVSNCFKDFNLCEQLQ